MKKIVLSLSLIAALFATGCNDEFLDRFPKTSIGPDNFFKSEDDMKMFAYSLYSFPNFSIYEADGYNTTDNGANTGSTELKNMLLNSNASADNITAGWSWGTLRNANLFIEKVKASSLSPDVIAHYEGLGRYFRAMFYIDKVKRFSDVPWYDKVLGTSDEELLYKARDPRALVVSKIFEDLDFAAANVKAVQPVGAINKWVVMAYKARFELYEGTFRKYHPELNLQSTSAAILERAKTTAKYIMDNGGFRLYSTGNPNADYANLFLTDNLTTNKEVIFANINKDAVKNSDSGHGMFGNYEISPSKDLLQSYLMSDGSFYTSQPNYRTKLFTEEFVNRDPRLKQTYAYPGWTLVRTGTFAQGGGLYKQQLQRNFTGYHQIKGMVNVTTQTIINAVDVPVLRYAETLLTYAEALAELGQLTQADLDKSINLIRARVNMPAMTMNPPVDAFQEAKYPNVKSSTQWKEILEIRRERRIELALEGYRYDDLMRWAAGKLTENPVIGLYFPALGKYDLNGDGAEDIMLLDINGVIPADAAKEKNALGEKLIYYRVGPVGSSATVFVDGNNMGYVVGDKARGTFVEPKYYYRPIPSSHVVVNPNLKQIMGW